VNGRTGSATDIQEEKDPKTFDELVRELNDLLEAKHKRIHPEHKPKAN
jgi:hypothetical protein